MLKTRITQILLAIIALTILNCAAVPKVDVYLESLCPGCQEFSLGSFSNYLQNPDFLKLANVTFYPYGNAKENKVDSHYEFTCQHGINECYGNVVEVCGLNKMSHVDGLHFMVCMENGIRTYGNYINKALIHCVQDQALLNDILACSTNQEGNLLQHLVAEATPSNHQYVPWIQFNGVHDEAIETKLMENMNDFLCGLEGNKDLEGCKNKEVIIQIHNIVYNNYNAPIQTCSNNFLNEFELKFLN